MGAKFEFKWNKPIAAVVKEATGGTKTLLFMAATWHRLYTPWVPMQSGALSSIVEYLVEGNKGIILHKVPYANRQFNGGGFNFRRDKHPLAQAQWDNGAISAGKGAVLARDTEAFIRRG